MPSTDATTSTPVLPRTAARPAELAGRPAPPPNRVSADSGTSTPISNRVSLSACLRGLQRAFRCSRRCCSRRLAHRGRPVTTRPTPPVTGPPPRPPPLPPPGPPPLPPPPPVVQVTIRGSQMKVGQGLGLSPWPPPRPPFCPPWRCSCAPYR